MNWIQYQDLVSTGEMSRLARKLKLPEDTNKWTTQNMIDFDRAVTQYRIDKLLKTAERTK